MAKEIIPPGPTTATVGRHELLGPKSRRAQFRAQRNATLPSHCTFGTEKRRLWISNRTTAVVEYHTIQAPALLLGFPDG
jgi:hypothetical protein